MEQESQLLQRQFIATIRSVIVVDRLNPNRNP